MGSWKAEKSRCKIKKGAGMFSEKSEKEVGLTKPGFWDHSYGNLRKIENVWKGDIAPQEDLW